MNETFQRIPTLRCADKGWVVARDTEDGQGTEFLMALARSSVWSRNPDDAMCSEDHGEALQWLDTASLTS
jgi:hypothetical protein